MAIKIEKFSANTIKELKYYVYVLTYKEDGSEKIFYVGKGKGDRVLAHFKEANKINLSSLKDTKITDKQKTLREKDVFGYIVSAGLTESEAFKLEAALIALLSKFTNDLTNLVKGHHSFEIKRVEEVESFYATPISLEEYCEGKNIKVMCLKLNEDSYELGKEKDFRGLLEGIWRMNQERLESTDFVLAVHQGTIIGVYKYISGTASKISDPNWNKEKWEHWGEVHYAMGRKLEFIENDEWDKIKNNKKQFNKLVFQLKPIHVQITQKIPPIKNIESKIKKIGKDLINRTITDKNIKGQNTIYYFGF